MFKTIKNHPRYEINIDGVIRVKSTLKIKSQYIGSSGYYMVSFSYNNKSRPCRVHRLLAETFILNTDNKPYINHIDGNKLNNCLNNLEWCTHKENMKHAFNNGLINNSGINNKRSKLTEEQVREIKFLLKDGKLSQYQIAKKIGNISRSAIMNIKNRNQWKHIK